MSRLPDEPRPRPPRRPARFRRATTLAAGGVAAARAFADATLEPDRRTRAAISRASTQASRTIHMPKASVPTLSPATVQHTEQAIKTYDGIVARGGWPEVPKVDGCGSATVTRRGRAAAAA